MGFQWAAVNATAMFQAGARNVDAMTDALKHGEGIEIRGLGSFTVRQYKPYNGRNPRTGAPVQVASKRLPFFKVGKELKEMVNSGTNKAVSPSSD